MMPKRVAETDPNKQISEFIGSGPFVFKQGRMEAGRQGGLRQVRQLQAAHGAGLGRSPAARSPRSIASSGSAIADPQQAVNALLAGEIDYYEQPPHDLLPLLAKATERQAGRLESARLAVHDALQPSAASRSTTRRSAGAILRASIRRTCSTPRSAIRSTTRSASRCSLRLAVRDQGGHRAVCSNPNFAEGARSC